MPSNRGDEYSAYGRRRPHCRPSARRGLPLPRRRLRPQGAAPRGDGGAAGGLGRAAPPAFADLPDIWERISNGDSHWLTLALGLRGGLVLRPHRALPRRRRGRRRRGSRIGLWASTADQPRRPRRDAPVRTGGAGGIALTAWAMRRSGMERARRRRAHGHVPRPALQRLHGRADRRRPRPLHRRAARRRLVRGDGRARDLRRRRDRAALAAQRVKPGEGRVRARDGADRPRRARRPAPAALRQRRPDRRADVVGLRHRRRCGRASRPSATRRRSA